MDNKQQLQEGLAALGLNLSTAQQLLLLEHATLLQKWNRTYNLTALRRNDQIISRHILDSLTLLPYVKEAKTLMDVGSGGGMLDANTKKTAFLQQTVIELGLSNVTVAAGRVETIYDKKVDVVTSRAFAELADFAALTKHLLNENGYWAAMKGVYPYEEIEQLPANIEVVSADKLDVPMLEAERHMVIMRPKRA